jgi:hypothetical protein
VPVAATLNVAVWPAVTVWLVGCVVIAGATAAAFTASVAALLVTVPAELLTTTSNVDPLSEVVVAGVVKLEEIAPAMFAPFFCHW